MPPEGPTAPESISPASPRRFVKACGLGKSTIPRHPGLPPSGRAGDCEGTGRYTVHAFGEEIGTYDCPGCRNCPKKHGLEALAEGNLVANSYGGPPVLPDEDDGQEDDLATALRRPAVFRPPAVVDPRRRAAPHGDPIFGLTRPPETLGAFIRRKVDEGAGKIVPNLPVPWLTVGGALGFDLDCTPAVLLASIARPGEWGATILIPFDDAGFELRAEVWPENGMGC